jgi:hypothetical protein
LNEPVYDHASPVLTTAQLCRLLRISSGTLVRWKRLGLPTLGGLSRGTHPKFLHRAVLAWLSNEARVPKPQVKRVARGATDKLPSRARRISGPPR